MVGLTLLAVYVGRPLLGSVIHRGIAEGMPMNAHGGVSLKSSCRQIKPGEPFEVMVSVRLDKGWHTYWTNPGDAGIPPKITWHLPKGWVAGAIQWPTPHRLLAPDVVSYGYEGLANLAVRITAPKDSRPGPALIAARVDWLVCREGCIATYGLVSKKIVVGHREIVDRDGEAQIQEVTRAFAKPAVAGRFRAYRTGSELFLKVDTPRNLAPRDTYFYSSDAIVEPSALQKLETSSTSALLRLKIASYAPKNVSRLRGLLTMLSGTRRIQESIDIPITEKNP